MVTLAAKRSLLLIGIPLIAAIYVLIKEPKFKEAGMIYLVITALVVLVYSYSTKLSLISILIILGAIVTLFFAINLTGFTQNIKLTLGGLTALFFVTLKK